MMVTTSQILETGTKKVPRGSLVLLVEKTLKVLTFKYLQRTDLQLKNGELSMLIRRSQRNQRREVSTTHLMVSKLVKSSISEQQCHYKELCKALKEEAI